MVKIEPIQSKLDLKVLISEQLAQIKSAMLHVLEKVGVRFPSE
jgi:trimethylamine:corrinoid methyltransferase-like protein